MIRLFETRSIRRKRLRRVRCVFCDLDGTLLTDHNSIHEDVKAAIAAVRSAGIRIVIASGRTDGFIRLYSSVLDPSSPVISLNGALVKRGDGSILTSHPLPDSIAAVLDDFQFTPDGAALTWSLFTPEGIMSLDERPLLPRYLRACEEEMHRVSDLTPYYPQAVSICTVGTYRSVQRLNVTLARKLGPRLKRVMYQSGSGKDRYYLEISLKRINKATGVRDVLEELNIPRTRSAAIGDYTNDVEMCTFVGVSAGMKNGNNAVREQADIITHRTNNDGGAADFLRMLSGQRPAR